VRDRDPRHSAAARMGFDQLDLTGPLDAFYLRGVKVKGRDLIAGGSCPALAATRSGRSPGPACTQGKKRVVGQCHQHGIRLFGMGGTLCILSLGVPCATCSRSTRGVTKRDPGDRT